MSKFENESSEQYEIDSKILEVNITFDELDEIIDEYLDTNVLLHENLQKLSIFVLQILYRSGVRVVDDEEVAKRVNNLIADRAMKLASDMGMVEGYYDEDEDKLEYSLTTKGRELLEERLDENGDNSTPNS